LGCKLVGVGQKNNKTVAANGFKRAMVDGLSWFNHKAPPGGKSDKKTEKNTVAFMADEVKNQTRKSNAKVCRQNEWRVD
jgi:hypothetical protein